METIGIAGLAPRRDIAELAARAHAEARAAAAAKIQRQIDALMAPGDPPKLARPSPAATTDELDRMTAMPDSDQGYGTGETSNISKQKLARSEYRRRSALHRGHCARRHRNRPPSRHRRTRRLCEL